MKKSVKVLSVIMAVVLVFACGVGATLAYLQAHTENVTNTFYASGLIDPNPSVKENFKLKEHEAVRDADNGKYTLNGTEVDANRYKVVPGNDLPKDPFVKIKPAENAYLYLEVIGTLPDGMVWTVNDTEHTSVDGDQPVAENWTKMTQKGPNDGDLYYRTNGIVPAGETVTVDVLTNNIVKVENTFNPDNLPEEQTLKFVAYAVQSTGFDSAAKAWDSVTFDSLPAA